MMVALVMLGSCVVASATPDEFTIDFENVPDQYLYNYPGGAVPLGNYYAAQFGVTLGSGAFVFDKTRYGGYNDFGYPPHSGTAVIGAPTANAYDITFSQGMFKVDAWYNTPYAMYMDAYDASNNLLASASGPANYGSTSPIGVADTEGRIFRVTIHDTGNYFGLDDLHCTTSPELSSSALLLLGALPIGLAWWRRRKA